MSLPLYTQDNDTLKKLLFALILLLILAIALSTYRYYAKGSLSKQIITLTQENQALTQRNAELDAQRKKAFDTMLEQQQSIAIQQATTNELQRQLATLQDELITLNQELDFYQNITSGQTTSKLHIKEFDITPESVIKGLYRYRLVISQGKKITQPLTGVIQLTIQGQEAQQEKSYDLTEHAMRLRHIQVIHGLIQLHTEFSPETLVVKIKQNKKTTLNSTLDWKELVQPVESER